MLLPAMLYIAQKYKDFYLGRQTNLFIIIDGIDLLVKSHNEDDLFWLPLYFSYLRLFVFY